MWEVLCSQKLRIPFQPVSHFQKSSNSRTFTTISRQFKLICVMPSFQRLEMAFQFYLPYLEGEASHLKKSQELTSICCFISIISLHLMPPLAFPLPVPLPWATYIRNKNAVHPYVQMPLHRTTNTPYKTKLNNKCTKICLTHILCLSSVKP